MNFESYVGSLRRKPLDRNSLELAQSHPSTPYPIKFFHVHRAVIRPSRGIAKHDRPNRPKQHAGRANTTPAGQHLTNPLDAHFLSNALSIWIVESNRSAASDNSGLPTAFHFDIRSSIFLFSRISWQPIRMVHYQDPHYHRELRILMPALVGPGVPVQSR